MSLQVMLDGRTRIAAILGDPIAQVKSPSEVTRQMQAEGHNWVLVPLHVKPADFSRCMAGLDVMRNVDGLVATVPHKLSAYAHCATVTSRAMFVGAANVLRRNADGSWHGDMVDGIGFVNGVRSAGVDLTGRAALLVGAGGAGSAIAMALIEAGVSRLSIVDPDVTRRIGLVERLKAFGASTVRVLEAPDPAGHTLIINASPIGMREGDPLPIQVEKLTADMVVCDVITEPEETPLLAEARRRGCVTVRGAAMYFGLLKLMTGFLCEAGSEQEPSRI